MITKEQTDVVLRKNIENIIKKAAAGSILSKAETELLQEHTAEDEIVEAKNWTELAGLLNITRKTVWALRKESNAPTSFIVEEWQDFLERRASIDNPHHTNEEWADSNLRELRAKLLGAQAGKEEAQRKLKEYELLQVEKQLVPMSEAREAIRKVMAPLRGLLDGLPKAAAMQVNPADPAHAEHALRDAMDKIFKMVETAEKNANRSG